MRQNRNEVLKKRYQLYRQLGYNSATSRALSQRALDVSSLEISKKTGKLKQNTKTKQFREETMRDWKARDAIENYHQKVKTYKNDTVYTRHGMLIQDKRYKGETGRTISIIKHRHNLTRDQAYYFFYMMNQYNLSYEDAKTQLLSNQEFEVYISKARRKNMSQSEYKKTIEYMRKHKPKK